MSEPKLPEEITDEDMRFVYHMRHRIPASHTRTRLVAIIDKLLAALAQKDARAEKAVAWCEAMLEWDAATKCADPRDPLGNKRFVAAMEASAEAAAAYRAARAEEPRRGE